VQTFTTACQEPVRDYSDGLPGHGGDLALAVTLSDAAVARLKPVLDQLYAQYDRPHAVDDPIDIVRRFDDPADREVVAFIAAGLAFGRVAGIVQSVERLLAVMRPSPAAFLATFDPRTHLPLLEGVGHRWIRSRDVAALLWTLRQMIARSGSIEAFFLEGYDPAAPDVGPAIDSFSSRALAMDLRPVYGSRRVRRRGPGVAYFFPKPSSGSACKRLNLFLRWMVRRDGVDFGRWTRVMATSLVIPLDTHIVRVGRCLGLTACASPGWRMAAEITASLRRVDAEDPVRYDFALCHLAMRHGCGVSERCRAEACPLREVCRGPARTARRSRPPSARR